ncbi:MAG TPA: response regulator [Thermoanaerobaculia bacterium]|nr:response regulator [Thermoanaerobaculia bacterium]
MTLRESKVVLITDDDAGIRQLLCRALEHHELSCDTATDGSQALEYLQARDYAVLLLDLMMPKVDGFSVLTAMSSWQKQLDTGPVVLVMTAFDGHLDLPVLDESVHALIRKPFDLPELAELVLGCVTLRRRSDMARTSPTGRSDA